MSTDNKQIVADAYAAMASGDIRGFLGILDPEIVVHEPPSLPQGGEYRGVQELLGMFKKAGGVLDAAGMTVGEITAEDDRVIVRLAIPLADGSATADILEFWRLRDGKAVELDVFWADTSIVAAQAAA